MAGDVALSQALSYARDLKSAYETARAREEELVVANDRLRKGYQQSLQYAVDLKRTHRQLQRSIFQSLLGLAAGADEYLTKPFSPLALMALVKSLVPEASAWLAT